MSLLYSCVGFQCSKLPVFRCNSHDDLTLFCHQHLNAHISENHSHNYQQFFIPIDYKQLIYTNQLIQNSEKYSNNNIQTLINNLKDQTQEIMLKLKQKNQEYKALITFQLKKHQDIKKFLVEISRLKNLPLHENSPIVSFILQGNVPVQQALEIIYELNLPSKQTQIQTSIIQRIKANRHYNTLKQIIQDIQEPQRLVNSQFNRRSFNNQNLILQELKKDEYFQYLLFIIKLSQTIPQLSQASANSITALKYGQLAGYQLRKISIPGADLSDGNFQCTDFTGSDMRFVNLTNTKLNNTSFVNCNLIGANFGNLDEFDKPTAQVTFSVAFFPCGTKFVQGSEDRIVKIWSLQTSEIVQSITGHTSVVQSVAVSPCGKKVLSGSRDSKIILFDTQTKEKRIFRNHSTWVLCVTFSPSGNSIASCSGDKTIVLESLVQQNARIVFNDHKDYVRFLSFSPDQKWLLSGSKDKNIILWNLEQKKIQMRYQIVHVNVKIVKFFPTGQHFVSGGSEGKIVLWSIKQKYPLHEINDYRKPILSISISPKAPVFVYSMQNGMIIERQFSDAKILKKWKVSDETVSSIAYSPNGKFILTGGGDETLKLWKVEQQKPEKYDYQYVEISSDLGMLKTKEEFYDLSTGLPVKGVTADTSFSPLHNLSVLDSVKNLVWCSTMGRLTNLKYRGALLSSIQTNQLNSFKILRK